MHAHYLPLLYDKLGIVMSYYEHHLYYRGKLTLESLVRMECVV